MGRVRDLHDRRSDQRTNPAPPALTSPQGRVRGRVDRYSTTGRHDMHRTMRPHGAATTETARLARVPAFAPFPAPTIGVRRFGVAEQGRPRRRRSTRWGLPWDGHVWLTGFVHPVVDRDLCSRSSGSRRLQGCDSSGSASTTVSWVACRASLARISRLRRSCRSSPKGGPRPTSSPTTHNWLSTAFAPRSRRIYCGEIMIPTIRKTVRTTVLI